MSDLFLSYSRKDASFVRQLHDALDGRGKEVWVDWQDIPPTAEWIDEIKGAIEKAESFAFVISPHSLASDICRIELEHAQKHNKRIIPLALHTDGEDEMPDVLQRLNWIVFASGAGIDEPVDKLIQAIETDLDWVREHTRLTTRAIEWEKESERAGYLLSGEDLDRAESQLEQGQDKEPRPTALQTRYIGASRRATTGRQRKILAATALALVLSIALGAAALVQRNRAQEAQRVAEDEALRAEAQKLLALGQLELETFPTGSLAYATRSLQLSDTEAGRLLALEALWKGPPAWHLPDIANGLSSKFSPDGKHLIQMVFTEPGKPVAHLVKSDGTWQALEAFDTGRSAGVFWQTDDLFLTWNPFHEDGAFWTLFSASEARPLATATTPRSSLPARWDPERGRLVLWTDDGSLFSTGMQDGEEAKFLGQLDYNFFGLGRRGRLATTLIDSAVSLVEILEEGLGEPRVVGRHPEAQEIHLATDAGLMISRDASGEIRLWDMSGESPVRVVQGPAGEAHQWSSLDPSGAIFYIHARSESGSRENWALSIADGHLRYLGDHALKDTPALDPQRFQIGLPVAGGVAYLQRLSAPDGTESMALKVDFLFEIHHLSFNPTGDWMASPIGGPYLFNVSRPYPMTLSAGSSLAFDPDGRWFVASAGPEVQLWPLEGDVWAPSRTVFTKPAGVISELVVSRDGEQLLIGKGRERADQGPILLSLDDNSSSLLPDGFVDQTLGHGFSPDGRYALALGGQFEDEENVIKVWDVETHELVATHEAEHKIDYDSADFTHDNEVLWGGSEGLFRWNLETGEQQLVFAGDIGVLKVSADGRIAVAGERGESGAILTAVDLETGSLKPIETHGTPLKYAVGAAGRVLATLGRDAVLRIGSVDGEEPHRFQVSTDVPKSVEVDPLGRWVAVIYRYGSVTLWPMPDLDQPPLHTLPLDTLVAELESLTNCRLLEDAESSTGWSIGWDTFPGWD